MILLKGLLRLMATLKPSKVLRDIQNKYLLSINRYHLMRLVCSPSYVTAILVISSTYIIFGHFYYTDIIYWTGDCRFVKLQDSRVFFLIYICFCQRFISVRLLMKIMEMLNYIISCLIFFALTYIVCFISSKSM